jgi:hypothetical protein
MLRTVSSPYGVLFYAKNIIYLNNMSKHTTILQIITKTQKNLELDGK